MSRWVVDIPAGESGDYKIESNTTTSGEQSWLTYVEHKGLTGGPYTVLYRKYTGDWGENWINIMQDTEAEYTEHDWLMSRMSGDIIIGGLGLGVVNVGLLVESNVTSVTIIEKEQDIIDLVWEHCDKDDRFTLINADVHEWEIPDGSSWDVGFFDTWLTHEESLSSYQTRINNKYGSFVTEISGWSW